ncbi:MAG TPA: rhodanese-like domain-containing protein [Pyrinomonadaceae bacterium]|nr:rhodanese-like domain-containing protein [Pyrinomonadaceae bacterium]
MRKVLLTVATAACVAVLAVLLSACKADDLGHKATSAQSNAASQPAQAKANADGVRRITVAELQQMLERGEAIVVDVRTKEQYALGHIKGAILMPTGEVSTRLGELPKDKQIVFYCA